MRLRGGCHCGNLAFVLDWTPEPLEIPARACTCSFCVKHGGVWTSCPTGTLTVTVAQPALVAPYAFETRTADFHVCMRCGVVPLVTSDIDGRRYAVVNVNAFEGVDPALIRRADVTHAGETEAARLARRRRNWIADVRYVESVA